MTNSALLIIDIQVGLIAGEQPAYRADDVLMNIKALTAQAHAAGRPVIYIQDKDVGGVGTPEWQIHPAIAPSDDDLVIRKAYGDAFLETTLHDELALRAVDHLVITGMKSEACVDLTSRRAIALGYEVTLVEDAHTTTDNEVLAAPQIVAFQNYQLEGFGSEDGFGKGERWIKVVSTSDVTF